jgi:hypothetical protein
MGGREEKGGDATGHHGAGSVLDCALDVTKGLDQEGQPGSDDEGTALGGHYVVTASALTARPSRPSPAECELDVLT